MYKYTGSFAQLDTFTFMNALKLNKFMSYNLDNFGYDEFHRSLQNIKGFNLAKHIENVYGFGSTEYSALRAIEKTSLGKAGKAAEDVF